MSTTYQVGEPGPELRFLLTPEQPALRKWRDHWPWRKALTLPDLPLHTADVQVFVRLNFGPTAWQYVVTLNGQPVTVPIALDPQNQVYIGMLPVPSPHVTVRWVPQGEVQPGIEQMWVEVTTE